MNSILFALFSFSHLYNFLWASEQTWSIPLEYQQNQLEFRAKGRPSVMKVIGKSNQLSGSIVIQNKSVTGKITLNISSLKTGIDLRDEHMKEKYLEIKSFPEATFTLNTLNLPIEDFTKNFELNQQPFSGTLSLHGVQKNIAGLTFIKKNNNRIELEAGFEIRLKDFGISTPQFSGITLAEEVKVTVIETLVLK